MHPHVDQFFRIEQGEAKFVFNEKEAHEDSALRNLLRDTLATRDQVTADLAKGDAAALSETQLVLSKLEQTAKH